MSTIKYYDDIAGEWKYASRGAQGPAGPGVAPGGTTGQILSKNSASDYDTGWIDPPTSGVWGQITGTLEDQTDLQAELNSKASRTTLIDGLPSGLGSNNQVIKMVSGTPQWAADTNTTYSEISEAEISAGTASTARAISGRRAQAIVDKARTGLQDAAVISSNGMGVVVHGSSAGTPRPSGFAQITWFGTVSPSNSIDNDIWINTA